MKGEYLMLAPRLKNNFDPQELRFMGQVAHDIETCLTEKFKHLNDSTEISLASYALALLSLDHCQHAIGPEATYKILKKYQDELEAHLKDQQVKGTPYTSHA